MDSKLRRKEAINKYKARKPNRGVFAVRCAATGQVWVGATPNLDAAKNSVWFSLRLGKHSDRDLQEKWNAHGEAAFEYEVLERLDEDESPIAVNDLLKEKKGLWAARFQAHALLR